MFLIILPLFLCQTHFNFGHVIPEFKHNLETANIFELNDNNSTAIRIQNHQADSPKLTEIVYYHIIEKPYDPQQQVVVEEISEENDERTRPFTNGHGYKFSKSGEETRESEEKLETYDEEKQEADESEEKEQTNDSEEKQQAGESEENEQADDSEEMQPTEESEEKQQAYDSEEKQRADESEENQQADESEETSNDVIVEKVTGVIYNHEDDDNAFEEVKADDFDFDTAETSIELTTARDNIEEIILEAEPTSTIPQVFQNTFEATTTSIKTDAIEKKIQERNQLFNNVKNRYKKIVAHDNLVRHKREISLEDIPRAPVLPELDFSILPDSIREQIEKALTENHKTPEAEIQNKSEEHIPQIEKEKQSTEDERDDKFDENFDKFFDKFFANLHLDDDSEEVSEGNHQTNEEREHSDEHIDKQNENIEDHSYQIDDVANFEEGGTPRQILRTYGMSIHGDNGYVWNDLYTNPGIYFDVGEDADKHEYVIKPLIEEPETVTETSHPELEDIQINIHRPNKTPPHIELLENTDHSTETVDDKPKFTETAVKPKPKPSEDHSDDRKSKINADHNENRKPKSNENHSDDEKPKTNEDNSDDGKGIKGEDIDVRHSFGDGDSKTDHLKSKVDKIEDILKDKQLWKWLAQWTDTHMDLLTKYIKKVVKEVVKNMDNEVAENKIEERNKTTEINKTTENNPTNKVERKHLNEGYNDEISNNNDEISKNVTQTKDTPKKPSVENDTLFIDEKEIPITHTTNFKDEIETEDVGPTLKGRKDKDNTFIHSRPSKTKDKDIKEGSNSIKAMNIYGNSMNNEKVTNVYVFIKSLDTNGIAALKPFITGDYKEKSPIDTLVVGNSDKVDVSTNTDSIINEKVTDTQHSETTSTKPNENNKIEPSTELPTSTDSKDLTAEANIESKLPEHDKIETVSTTEKSEGHTDTLVVSNSDTVDMSTKPDSKIKEKLTDTPDSETISTKPIENNKIEPTTELSTSTESKDLTTANIESKLPVDNKIETVSTTEKSESHTELNKNKESEEILEVQKNINLNELTSETKVESTTVVPGSNKKEEVVQNDATDKVPESQKSDEKELKDNKETVENKTESTTIVPGSDKKEDIVQKVGADKEPGSQKTEDKDKESETTTFKLEETDKGVTKAEDKVDKDIVESSNKIKHK